MNVGDWIIKRALNYPQLTMVQEGERRLDNHEFNVAVNRVANTILETGLVQGDRLAVLMENSIEYLLVLFACAKTGVIMVPMNTQLTPEDLGHMIRDCRPKLVLYGPAAKDAVTEIAEDRPQEVRYMPVGLEDDPIDSLSARVVGAGVEEPAIGRRVDTQAPLLIVYLPGYTTDPRGAVLTHDNILFGAIHSLLSYNLDRTYKSLVLAPMYQIGALAASVFPVVYTGGSLLLESFYNPSRILSLIQTEKVNYMFAVPVMYQMLTKTPEWAAADFSHVHYFISGGAPMPVEVIRKYQNEKNISFVQGYGMTETGRLTSLDLEDSRRKAGSVGKEVFHLELRIVDESGRDAPTGELGEIIVRGPNVFQSYWNRPEETRTALKDGWFHTQDLGRRDSEGFIYLEGRKVETIISSGRNFYPVEVERVLAKVRGVAEAVVVGLPDAGKGQVAGAAVVLHPGVVSSKDEILTHLQGKIAGFKIPKTIRILDSLPRQTSGQINRDAVRRLLKP
jgi:fatty-acyl-CoA synthase